MTFQQRHDYVCEYDGVDTATTYDGSLPPGWVVLSRGGVSDQHYHSAAHAALGNGGAGGVYSPGLTSTPQYVDDQDGTISVGTPAALPSGWRAVARGGVTYHFKDATNEAAWLAANP